MSTSSPSASYRSHPAGAGYGTQSFESQTALYPNNSHPQYQAVPPKEYPPQSYASPSKRPSNRKWWIIGLVVLVIVIIGAVVGGVVGTRSHSNSNAVAQTSQGTNSGAGSQGGSSSGGSSNSGNPTSTQFNLVPLDAHGNPLYVSSHPALAPISSPQSDATPSSLALAPRPLQTLPLQPQPINAVPTPGRRHLPIPSLTFNFVPPTLV